MGPKVEPAVVTLIDDYIINPYKYLLLFTFILINLGYYQAWSEELQFGVVEKEDWMLTPKWDD